MFENWQPFWDVLILLSVAVVFTPVFAYIDKQERKENGN